MSLFQAVTSRTKTIFAWIFRISVVVCLTNTAHASMVFSNVTSSSGIDHLFTPQGYETTVGFDFNVYHGSAVAEDFDGDGWMDLYVMQNDGNTNLLYMNQGDGTFVDEAAFRGAALTNYFLGCAAADYDSDGDVDVVLTCYESPHYLLVNNGTGSFTVNTNMILEPALEATSPSWGDIDNDGDLDLVIGHHEAPGTLYLYYNDGAGGLSVGQTFPVDYMWTPAFADLNGDRYPELLAVADFTNAVWYTNDRGIFLQAGASDIENGMGCATGDIDNDGDLDWFMSSVETFGGNRMLSNDGTGELTDITSSANLRYGFWGWGATLTDFDLDGDLDAYHVNGWPSTYGSYFNNTPAMMFVNVGGGTFTNLPAGDANDTGDGRAVVVFDYDNDGDQDIFIANNRMLDTNDTIHPAAPVLLRNDSAPTNHWLKVSLEGMSPGYHSQGIGARVYTSSGSFNQMRELAASSHGFGHGPDRIAHFGLGNDTMVDEVRAVWNNGDEVIVRDVAVDQAITLESPLATASAKLLTSDGGDVAFDIDEGLFPSGYGFEWVYGGSTNANPASIHFSAPGEYLVELRVYDDSVPPNLVRTERLMVTVVEPPVLPGTIARVWNEQNLDAIRIDFPDPTKHARNLFHTSVAMWDAWAAYTNGAVGYLHRETATAGDVEAARNEALSYAAYRVLKSRYADGVNGSTTLLLLERQMAELGYDTGITATNGSTPAALGNRVAQTVLSYYADDGWDVFDQFMGGEYVATNAPLVLTNSGTILVDSNRWQPLLFVNAVTQNGQEADVIQTFLGPNWGIVRPFAHTSLMDELLHIDPGAPPKLGGVGDADYKAGNVVVIDHSSRLDPASGVMIDISPGAYGNNTLGSNDGTGRALNPYTGQPYASNVVNHADFGRVLAEFWADGPDSETPPGHWNTLANAMVDHPQFTNRFEGVGDLLGPLEWDVKMYFAMNGALHDAAIAAWGCKRVYDYIRPISSIRLLASLGQSSEPLGPSYHPQGIPLVTGLVEVVTAETTLAGQRHEHLAGSEGQIAIKAWRGESALGGTNTYAGVDWILAADWMPYQRSTFVTPAFPGYVSGHSTFSRAAAEVLTAMTGTEYFPGGLQTFTALKDEFLEFEEGPTTDVVLEWATYYDAADQAGISRLYGGIHVPADDGPGRIMGAECGMAAWALARKYFDGSITNEVFRSGFAADLGGNGELSWEALRGAYYRVQQADGLTNGFTDLGNWIQATETVEGVSEPVSIGVPIRLYRVQRSFEPPESP